MLSSSITKQAEEVVEEVPRTIREEEYANPSPVLCETDRKRFMDEEESVRNQPKETIESESSQNSLRGLLGLPSPHGAGGVLLLADTKPARAVIISGPLNMRCSLSEPGFSEVNSEVNVNPAAQNDHDYTSDINDAINSPLETPSEFSDRNHDSSSRRRRRPPPPPPPRRMTPSINSCPLSEISGSDSPRRSSSVRRSAPPPPQSPKQSRTLRSPTNASFHPPGSLSLDPDLVSSISRLAQHMNTLASSIATEGSSRQAQGRQRVRHSGYVTKTNCIDINGSNVDGVTVNNGSYNSGAVIHKTMMPPSRLPQHAPPF